jgi:hypothetical protein
MSKDDDRRYEGVPFRGLANYQAPTERDIQAGISNAMRDVVRHDSGSVHNPSSVAATPAGTERARGTGGSENGWVEPKPLGLPPGVALIDQLCDVMLPHAPGYGKPKSGMK